MPIEITMPRLSDTMEEGTLIKWLVKVGDKVASGDHLADVETDKATMELSTFDDGTVASIVIDEGQTAKVGSLIAVLAADGESVEDAAKSAGGPPSQPKPRAEAGPTAEAPYRVAAKVAASGERIKVSPLARKLAEEQGLDLTQIKGTGPDGRIIKRDILAAAEAGEPATAPPPKPRAEAGLPAEAPDRGAAMQPLPGAPVAQVLLEDKSIPLTGMRKTIAKRLVESKTTMPHFQVTLSVNMDPLLALREMINSQLESQGVKLSVNDFIVRAVALALARRPAINSSWAPGGDAIQQHGSIHVGVAVALPPEKGGGLVVPVIKDAINKGVRQIADETRNLAKKARETGLSPDDMTGGTFTISNLGMFGVDHFTAIINPPQAAILAIGAALKKPVVRNNQITIGSDMAMTMSADHRVIDGAMAAEFLNTLKQILEAPAALLV